MANQKGRKTKPSLKQQEDEDSEGRGGMFLEKEDIQLIYNALSRYKPTEKEEHLHGILLEEFEEILVCDYQEVSFE